MQVAICSRPDIREPTACENDKQLNQVLRRTSRINRINRNIWLVVNVGA